jgi:hypothetical protein
MHNEEIENIIRRKNVAAFKEILERRLGKDNAKLIIDYVIKKEYREV